ncbi:MAG: glycosyltransferase family 1 protein [Verrucomicrobiales bacterium]|nr:glycosyltransferase family 1 protein [Verrucomicrobiales bacterium]
MHILIDLQACQSASRLRGVGRYSMSLSLEVVRQAVSRGHEISILLNAAFPDSISPISRVFDDLGHQVGVVLFRVPRPCAAMNMANGWRQRSAEVLRERAIAQVNPDFVIVSTLLPDGWVDDSVVSVGTLGLSVPVAVVHYDLIPLSMQDLYLVDKAFREFYFRKIEDLKRADLLLAISEYTRAETIDLLGVSESSIVNISSAVDEGFGDQSENIEDDSVKIISSFGVKSGYLLYVPGGFDPRKNLDRLIEAYGNIPMSLRNRHQLVIGSKLEPNTTKALRDRANECGVGIEQMVLTDYITDEELVHLYKGCLAYVFPSLHEGFGLPVLEAMACGAAVIASDISSLPEVVGCDEAMFDPYSVSSIADKIAQVLSDDNFRERLREHSCVQLSKFSWKRSAELAISAIEEKHAQLISDGKTDNTDDRLPNCEALLESMESLDLEFGPQDLTLFRSCFEDNISFTNPESKGQVLSEKEGKD